MEFGRFLHLRRQLGHSLSPHHLASSIIFTTRLTNQPFRHKSYYPGISRYMASSQAPAAETTPWHAKYPAPKCTPRDISREEVLRMSKDASLVAGRDYLLVDVRRNDFEGGTIRGSMNLPAQSLNATLPVIFQTVKAAGISQVIFYCGSSSGRGPRAAGWFGDYIAGQAYEGMESLVLTGGIKGWVAAGVEYVEQMEEYDAAAWAAQSQ